jgi:hypothetical protein
VVDPTGFGVTDYFWSLMGLRKTYFIRNSCLCTLRVEISCLIYMKSKICQQKSEKDRQYTYHCGSDYLVLLNLESNKYYLF